MGLALLAALSAGCRALEIDLYPVLRSGPVDDRGGWAWEALGPLIYSHEDHPDGGAACREWGVRPLFSRHHDTGSGRSQTELLWPIGRFRRGPGDWYDRILPLYWNWGNTEPEPARSSLFLFPLFLRRTGPPGEGWALFPFYGRVENFFGMNEVSFVMFPLYASDERSRCTSHHVLWPVFGWGTGQEGGWFRVFPLIARSWETGDHDTHTYLWPFVNFGEDLGRTDRPRTSVLVWPFYGRWTREEASGWTVLFPLFRGHEDLRKGEGDLNCPWPFYQAWWSPREDGWRLWPFVWDREFQYLEERHEEFRVVPVFHHGTWTDPHGGGTRWMVFPLADSERRATGSGKFAVGTLFPLRIWNDAAQERWSVFLSPYIHWWWADGRARSQSILGLYRRYEAPGFTRWTVPVLCSHRASGSGTLDQFLLGALRYEVEASGASCLRILGVPIPLSGGDPDASRPAAARGDT